MQKTLLELQTVHVVETQTIDARTLSCLWKWLSRTRPRNASSIRHDWNRCERSLLKLSMILSSHGRRTAHWRQLALSRTSPTERGLMWKLIIRQDFQILPDAANIKNFAAMRRRGEAITVNITVFHHLNSAGELVLYPASICLFHERSLPFSLRLSILQALSRVALIWWWCQLLNVEDVYESFLPYEGPERLRKRSHLAYYVFNGF